MWVLKQLWFWIDLAALILILIAAIASTVYHKRKIPLWCWILFDIGIGLLIIAFFIMLFQVSIDRRLLEKRQEKLVIANC